MRLTLFWPAHLAQGCWSDQVWIMTMRTSSPNWAFHNLSGILRILTGSHTRIVRHGTHYEVGEVLRG